MQRGSRLAMLFVASALLLITQQAVATGENPTAIAKFACRDGKTISATFYSNSVELKLSDGRSFNVPQTLSGSGARYANSDETFEFWNKGDTAFITEGQQQRNLLWVRGCEVTCHGNACGTRIWLFYFNLRLSLPFTFQSFKGGHPIKGNLGGNGGAIRVYAVQRAQDSSACEPTKKDKGSISLGRVLINAQPKC
jgi:membrane-bound inhibitor of C-type lysozyme